MVHGIRGFPLLEGYRGAPASNVASLLDVLHRVSRMVVEQPEILELDLNPVLVFPGVAPCVALDARLKLARVATAPALPPDSAAGEARAGSESARVPAASTPEP
jgi:hypothetical protein